MPKEMKKINDFSVVLTLYPSSCLIFVIIVIPKWADINLISSQKCVMRLRKCLFVPYRVNSGVEGHTCTVAFLRRRKAMRHVLSVLGGSQVKHCGRFSVNRVYRFLQIFVVPSSDVITRCETVSTISTQFTTDSSNLHKSHLQNTITACCGSPCISYD